MIINGKELDDTWFPAFSRIVGKLDIPILNNLFAYFVAFHLKGKSGDQLNETLKMESDLTSAEQKMLGNLFDNNEALLFD
jgi:hypothetical protein